MKEFNECLICKHAVYKESELAASRLTNSPINFSCKHPQGPSISSNPTLNDIKNWINGCSKYEKL